MSNKIPEIKVESLKKLSEYEQKFVLNYSQQKDLLSAMKKTRKDMKLPVSRGDLLLAEGQMMLTKGDVSKAVKSMKSVIAGQTEVAVAKSGLKVAELWSNLATNNDDIVLATNMVERAKIKMTGAITPEEEDKWERSMMSWMSKKSKLEEVARKNLVAANDISGMSKQKIEMKVGSLNINMGNQTITSKETKDNLKVVEADVKENDIIDLEEIGETNG